MEIKNQDMKWNTVRMVLLLVKTMLSRKNPNKDFEAELENSIFAVG